MNEATETPVVEDVTDDLDTFANELFGKAKPSEKQEDVEDTEDSGDTEDDTLAPENEDEAVDEDEAPDEEEKPVEKPKSRFQERIDELTTDKKQAQREAEELRQRLEEALAKLNAVESKPKDEAKTAATTATEDGAPHPDDLLDDGSAKYPLGEFDPAFIRDLTRHAIAAETARVKAAEAEEARKNEQQRAQAALEAEWSGRLESAVKDKYPDMLEKNVILRDTFATLDPAYGQYLATTIMNLEYGPDVLYHLASNIDEAKKIVASGATAATVALGRLEARFALAEEERREQKLKVSKAPQPPERVNKGTTVSKEVPDDTDDLDAFANKLFNKNYRKR